MEPQQIEADRLQRRHGVAKALLHQIPLGDEILEHPIAPLGDGGGRDPGLTLPPSPFPRPSEPHLACEIDHAHPAAPQLALQRIAAGEGGLEVQKQAVESGQRRLTTAQDSRGRPRTAQVVERLLEGIALQYEPMNAGRLGPSWAVLGRPGPSLTVLDRPRAIVSLLPAATEIVAALGATGRLVGVSHECDYPPEVRTLPRVTYTTVDHARPSGAIDRQMAAAQASGGSPVRVDIDLLRRLAPDVVLGQSLCEICAVGEDELARAAAALAPRPAVVTLHAHSLDGVFADIARVGDALDLADEAAELVAGLRYRLRRLGRSPSPVSGRGPGGEARVLVLEWLDPPYVAGHWVPELIEIAGGVDVGSRPGERSRPRPWAELRALAPGIVVIACCGFDISRARMEFAAVTDPDALALFERRVEFLDGNAYTSRPGPRLVDAAEILSQLIAG